MPDNGVILVFCDSGSHRLELETSIAEKARQKNVKIFFAIFLNQYHINQGFTAADYPLANYQEVYKRLSEGRIFRVSPNEVLDLSSKNFLDSVVRTVSS